MPSPWNRGLRAPLAARLWDKIDVGDGDPDTCWQFKGDWRSRFGYGRIRDESGNAVQAHKAMYELCTGEPVPEGMYLLHECDTPSCCNPRHMHPGTAGENRWDQFAHGAYAEEAG